MLLPQSVPSESAGFSHIWCLNLANVADQFGIQLDRSPADHGHSTAISNDIYLNATEEAIKDLMANGTVYNLKLTTLTFTLKLI